MLCKKYKNHTGHLQFLPTSKDSPFHSISTISIQQMSKFSINNMVWSYLTMYSTKNKLKGALMIFGLKFKVDLSLKKLIEKINSHGITLQISPCYINMVLLQKNPFQKENNCGITDAILIYTKHSKVYTNWAPVKQ